MLTWGLCEVFHALGRADAALLHFQQAAQHYEEEGQREESARVLHNLGIIWRSFGEAEIAEERNWPARFRSTLRQNASVSAQPI